MSAHIIELDLTDENKSHIKLTFTDTVKKQLLSTIIEKFSIPKSTTENMVGDKRSKSVQEIFKRYRDEAESGGDRSAKKDKAEEGIDSESCQI